MTQLQPLKHQLETIENLDNNFQNNKNKNMVVLPSGSGKTHTVAFHVAKIKPKTFLYIVHRNEILFPTIKIFKAICNLDKDKDIGIINQEHKQFDKPYTFATIQTISRPKTLEQLDRKQFEYFVLDEYHHSAAD